MSTLYQGPLRAPVGTSQWRAFRTNYLDSTITSYFQQDGDGDGLPDAWETQHFSGPSQDGAGDPEEDGVNNATEYLIGTNPTTPNLRVRIVQPRLAFP